jgi:hypothetical protein
VAIAAIKPKGQVGGDAPRLFVGFAARTFLFRLEVGERFGFDHRRPLFGLFRSKIIRLSPYRARFSA